MTERPERPEVSIFRHGDTQWEVHIKTHTGLDASVKVGKDHRGDSSVTIDVEPDDERIELRSSSGLDYATFASPQDP